MIHWEVHLLPESQRAEKKVVVVRSTPRSTVYNWPCYDQDSVWLLKKKTVHPTPCHSPCPVGLAIDRLDGELIRAGDRTKPRDRIFLFSFSLIKLSSFLCPRTRTQTRRRTLGVSVFIVQLLDSSLEVWTGCCHRHHDKRQRLDKDDDDGSRFFIWLALCDPCPSLPCLCCTQVLLPIPGMMHTWLCQHHSGALVSLFFCYIYQAPLGSCSCVNKKSEFQEMGFSCCYGLL